MTMVDFLPGISAPVPAENRTAQHRQAHMPAGDLAQQQPSLVPPVTAQVTASADAARSVRDRNRERREKRRPQSREPGRGGLLDREL